MTISFTQNLESGKEQVALKMTLSTQCPLSTPIQNTCGILTKQPTVRLKVSFITLVIMEIIMTMMIIESRVVYEIIRGAAASLGSGEGLKWVGMK